MAAKKSKQYPFQWSDGTWHSNTQAQHEANMVKAGFTPAGAPAGSYDPDLDAQRLASSTSLDDLTKDIDPVTGRLTARAQDDLNLGLAGIATGRKREGEDFATATSETGRGFDRSLSDLITGRTREGEDYGTSLANLSRQYQQLGDAQTQADRAAGAMAGSGAQIQAARKRAANQEIDKSPIDLAHKRYGEDSTLGETRIGEDRKSAIDRLNLGHTRAGEDFDTEGKGLGLAFDRQADDWKTQLKRATQADTDFGLAIHNQQQYQYGGPQLWTPPAKTTGADVVSGPGALAGPPAPSLTAGPNAPRQPGAKRTVTTKKKGGKKVRTYGTSVTTA